MEKVRLAIIGTGGISNSHVEAYKQMEDVEIVGGADIIPGKARVALTRWGFPEAPAFESAKEMLDTVKPDAVSVCTYNSTHAECAALAMESGCHVLLEKPMTVTLEDAIHLRKVEKSRAASWARYTMYRPVEAAAGASRAAPLSRSATPE